MATTRLYRDGTLVAEDFPVAQISDHLGEPGATVWADFVSPTEQDLSAIQRELGLHRLAVEDATHEHQRPKLDIYDSHWFLAAYDMRFEEQTGRVAKHEVTAFITEHALVTVHDESFDVRRVTDRWDSVADLAGAGSAFLLWGLLDVIVDAQFDAVRQLDQAADDIEDLLFDDGPHDREIGRRSFALRKSIVFVRRAVLPMRDVVSGVMRHDLTRAQAAIAPYYQDVFDHVLRTIEWTDTVRDLLATIVDTHEGVRANRMNLVMKKVTSWAAIIAVPTAITGFFGQNLLFPGYGTGWGVALSTLLIVATGVGLFAAFKRNDWL
ncbi:magnesium transporter CorA family protein [Galbitalea sp. SE-J8]|uniref:magnesium transporter CorA family protein n=1 Tax=Galbitalea sp. SE-J8 TaxID=3054952 RepID=UPI00259CE8DB|nr:magnesium transporter CorA family protein [Galbitalea sp. SE-J8]MDM4762665.1 magnesium transporter CorA family protein [Galbitalea sp. SE-J8]